MKIYIDFDRTLFNCDKFLKDFYILLSRYKINKELFRECQNQCSRKGFNPYDILQKVEKKTVIDQKVYQAVDRLISKTEKYLYSDSKDFLKYLKKQGYEIIILTKGNLEYQKMKVMNAHLSDYYDDLIVSMHHKGHLIIDYTNGIFLDDNPKELKSIIKKHPKMVIRLRRKESKYAADVIRQNVVEVTSLSEIISKEIL